MKTKKVLDPLWIISSNHLDPEYFSYILLAASQKYRKDLEEGDLRYFYELFFHSLNLNSLAVDGHIYDSKMHAVWKNEKILQIKKELKRIYEPQNEVVEIFRNANYVFLSLIIEYMDQQLAAIDMMEFFYLNERLHEQKEIFIVMNSVGSKKYSIWLLKDDESKDFGHSFRKVRTVIIDEIKENALKEKIHELQDKTLLRMKDANNVCFAIIDDTDDRLYANVLKDTILLNKGIAKGILFEPTIINELQNVLLLERLMPFTLDQWID